MSGFPLHPPTMAAPVPPTGEVHFGGEPEVDAVEQRGMRQRVLESRVGQAAGAVILVGGLIGGGLAYASTSNEKPAVAASSNTGDKSGAQAPSDKADKVCPNGMFDPKNPMELASKVRPGDLHVRPESPITTDKEFFGYMFGEKDEEKGVLCALPTDLATYQKVFDSWVGGEGESGRPFSSLVGGANQLADFFATNPEDADVAVRSESFVSFVEGMKDNTEVINSGTYFELTLVDGVITQVPVDLPVMEPGTVRTLGAKVWVGDRAFSGNGQKVIQFNSDAKLYILNSLGDTPISPTTTTTSSTTTSTPESGSASGAAGTDGSAESAGGTCSGCGAATGGSGSTTGGGSGSGTCGSCAGSGSGGGTGTGPGTGSGGTGPGTGGGGGGTGPGTGGGGNGPGTTGPKPTNAPTTRPPATNPPTTRPPATNPPTTRPPATNPPVTSPPTTVPTTKPPLNCDPNIEDNC